MSAGMADSMIRIWSLNNTKLRSIRSPNELELLDKDAGRPRYFNIHYLMHHSLYTSLESLGLCINALIRTRISVGDTAFAHEDGDT